MLHFPALFPDMLLLRQALKYSIEDSTWLLRVAEIRAGAGHIVCCHQVSIMCVLNEAKANAKTKVFRPSFFAITILIESVRKLSRI